MNGLVLAELTSVVTASVGASVWIKSGRTSMGTHFFLFACTVALWTASNGLVHSFGATSLGPLWGRLAFFSASLIPVSFFLFVRVFPSSEPCTPLVRYLQNVWIWSGVLFSLLSLTPLILVSTDNINDVLAVTYGPLHLPFGVYFVTYLLSALYLLNQKRRRLTGTDRAHTKYLMIAVLSSALGATVTNLILPLVVGTSRYGEYGPLFTLLLVGLLGHAILRHRLMNIRFVIRRGVVYLTACVASGLAFSGLLLFLAFVFSGEHYVSIATILIALTVAVLFHPLKERIRVQCERYLYREPYDYQQIVRDTSRLLGGTIELYELLSYFGSAVYRALKSNGIAVYILAEDEVSFVVAWCSRPQDFPSHASLRPIHHCHR